MPKLTGALGNGAFRTASAIAAVGFFTNLCGRLLSKSSKVVSSLGASSYDVYLIHLPVVMGFQLLLLPLGLPVYLKALLATVVPFTFCWGSAPS